MRKSKKKDPPASQAGKGNVRSDRDTIGPALPKSEPRVTLPVKRKTPKRPVD